MSQKWFVAAHTAGINGNKREFDCMKLYIDQEIHRIDQCFRNDEDDQTVQVSFTYICFIFLK